ncbi:MAG: hypothetical protein R2684_00845 [Pyrinomonadaceae bacterium]
MISGFNTDIEHEGVVYHVQTEDKGLKTPFVLSLVYQEGTILASKRSPYDDLIESGFDESELEERVQRQHKLMCAAIRAGRIEDLKRMTMNRAKEEGTLVARKREVIKAPAEAELPKPAFLDEAPDSGEAPIPMPQEQAEPHPAPVWDIPLLEDVEIVDATVIDGNLIVEEEFLLPPEAVKVIEGFDRFDSLFADELKVKLLGTENFYSGEQKNVNILVCRGKDERAVAGAGIMVKVLGSDFRPQIFHAVADENGVATVSVIVPEFRSGRAAVLVRAMVGNEEAEIRRAITIPE